MTDRIELHRLGSVFAPAQKVTPLRREGRDPRQKPFERHLMGDGDGQGKDARDLDPDNQGPRQEPDQPEGDITCDDGNGPRSGQEDRLGEDPPPGSLVDIRV